MNAEQGLNLINNALAIGRDMALPPLAVVVLDSRACVKASVSDDGVGTLRYDIALGKASAALGMGFGTRQFHQLVKRNILPEMFANCINGAAQGKFIPLPGGVLILDKAQRVVGAMGISGANSDQDEAVAVRALESEGFIASP